ncbi:MAG TPA: tetratricopeptide repeat protein, partial [Spirochaetota bacterium]|nr:tetratricopeptide repeat protein [Spirochaetota bacterium]
FNNWDEIATWYSPIVENILSNGNVAKDVLSKLPLKDKTVLEKIDIVYQYVQKNINYIGIELGESALIPHNPNEIYKNKFGDCKDQAIFLIYLLRSIGVKAYPVLVSTTDNGQPEKSVPSPYYFNHMISYIPVQDGVDKEIFCDTTSSVTELYNLPSLDQGVTVFIVKNDNTGFLYKTPVIEYSKNRIEEYYLGDVSIAGDGDLYFTEILSGTYAEMIRYAIIGKSEAEALDYMYGYQSKTYKDLKREDLKVEGLEKQSGPLKISLKSYDKSLTSVYFDGNQKVNFKIKDINSLLSIPTNLKYDYVRNFLFSYKKTIEYKFPEGYKITEGSPKNFIKENQYIKFEAGSKLISDNNFALFFEIIFKEREVKNEDLKKISDFLGQIEIELSTELVVAKEKDFDFIVFYDKLIKTYEQKEVFENYIRKMISSRNIAQAKKICDEAMKKFPKEQNFYILKANILIEENDMESAESVLNNFLSINKDEPTIYVYLNEVYKKMQDDEKEEKNLLLAIEKFSNNTEFFVELVNLYNRKELFDKSIELIKKLIEKNPKNSGFYGNLGYAYSLKRDFKNAEESFLKSIELDPKNASSLNNIAWLYCEHDTKITEAIEYAKKAVSYEPLNDSYLDTLAEAYFKNKEWDKAIDAIKKAMKVNPNYTYLQQQLDKIEKAKKMMEK